MVHLNKVHSARQAQPVQPDEARAAKDNRRPAHADQVEISAAGRQAAYVGQLARRVLELPEARPDAVAAGQRALDRGDLDSPATLRATAQALLGTK